MILFKQQKMIGLLRFSVQRMIGGEPRLFAIFRLVHQRKCVFHFSCRIKLESQGLATIQVILCEQPIIIQIYLFVTAWLVHHPHFF